MEPFPSTICYETIFTVKGTTCICTLSTIDKWTFQIEILLCIMSFPYLKSFNRSPLPLGENLNSLEESILFPLISELACSPHFRDEDGYIFILYALCPCSVIRPYSKLNSWGKRKWAQAVMIRCFVPPPTDSSPHSPAGILRAQSEGKLTAWGKKRRQQKACLAFLKIWVGTFITPKDVQTLTGLLSQVACLATNSRSRPSMLS